MPMTRKQAWRRVRVRQELGETKDESSPRGSKRSVGDKMHPAERQRQQQQQQQQQQQEEGGQETERSSPERAPNGGSAIRSPERKVLDKWRLPKEGREPSARPGVSASKRQAAAACVRVGSRVSFNTVVAAILIPSAKDLHAAARRELWWQETDYRDFRMNFIQFMRNPPVENDDLEMSPVDIAADAASEVAAEDEEKQMTVEDLPQPVMVSAIVYEDSSTPPCDARTENSSSVCAWAVEGSQGSEEKEAPAATVSVSSSTAAAEGIVESDIEARVLAAATAATTAASSAITASAAAAAASNAVATPATASSVEVEVEFSPPAAAPVTLIVEASEAAAVCSCSIEVPRPSALPAVAVACDASDYTVGDEGGDGNAAVDGGGCWDEQETNCRVPPCLTWASAADAQEVEAGQGEEEEEEDGEDNIVRVRRSFSNLETARRLGAGQLSAAAGEDPTDSDDGGEESASQSRPRALSLDGWFTCGLENDVATSSYESHDHAGRLRELVKLPPFPAMSATAPPPRAISSPKPDLAEAMRKLRVTFNVSVNEDAVAGKQGAGGMECNASGGDMVHGETKCRAEEEEEAVMSFPSATASRSFSDLSAGVDSRSIGKMSVGIQPDFDLCVA